MTDKQENNDDLGTSRDRNDLGAGVDGGMGTVPAMTEADRSSLVASAVALLALNARGAAVPPIPGLAVRIIQDFIDLEGKPV